MTKSLSHHTITVCGVYLLLASLWIFLSDQLIEYLAGPENVTQLQSSKGLLFVLVTSSLLFVLITRKNNSIKELFSKVRGQMQHFQATFEQAAVGIVHISKDESWIRVNKKICEILGYTYQEFKTLSLEDIVYPDDLQAGREMDQRVINGELESYVMEKRYITKGGDVIHARLTKSGVRDSDGNLDYIIAIIEQIGAQKKAEHQLKQSLEDKEKLLAEIHHRVKNNLAVISGLMELQSLYTGNETTRQILKESMLRIKSMALIHESYYEAGKLSHVTVNNYLNDFVQYIQNAYSDANPNVKIKLDTVPLHLNINQAIPCGLLLTELLISYYTSDFHCKEDATIDVTLRESDNESVILKIESELENASVDKAEEQEQDTLTATIISALVRQLEAQLNTVKETGKMCYTVTFNRAAEKKGPSNAYLSSGVG